MSIKQKISSLLERFLRNFLNSYMEDVFTSNNKNIERQLQKNAIKSSAKYVEENMEKAIAVNSKFEVLDNALSNISIKGLFLEFGVFKGQTINYISKKTENEVHGFDSFEGLPEKWRSDFEEGAFDLKNKLPKVNSNVKLHKGWFDASIPEFQKTYDENIAFLHVDCDLYSSTKTIFNLFKSKIVSGTVIVFDEYFNYPGWKNHEYKAFAELIKESGLDYSYLSYNRYNEQVAVIIK